MLIQFNREMKNDGHKEAFRNKITELAIKKYKQRVYDDKEVLKGWKVRQNGLRREDTMGY